MSNQEWVWLRHPDTRGVQHVPPAAVDTWAELGWRSCDPPTEPNPALAEYTPITNRPTTTTVAPDESDTDDEEEMSRG